MRRRPCSRSCRGWTTQTCRRVIPFGWIGHVLERSLFFSFGLRGCLELLTTVAGCLAVSSLSFIRNGLFRRPLRRFVVCSPNLQSFAAWWITRFMRGAAVLFLWSIVIGLGWILR